jgi:hypothetical protein
MPVNTLACSRLFQGDIKDSGSDVFTNVTDLSGTANQIRDTDFIRVSCSDQLGKVAQIARGLQPQIHRRTSVYASTTSP